MLQCVYMSLERGASDFIECCSLPTQPRWFRAEGHTRFLSFLVDLMAWESFLACCFLLFGWCFVSWSWFLRALTFPYFSHSCRLAYFALLRSVWCFTSSSVPWHQRRDMMWHGTANVLPASTSILAGDAGRAEGMKQEAMTFKSVADAIWQRSVACCFCFSGCWSCPI